MKEHFVGTMLVVLASATAIAGCTVTTSDGDDDTGGTNSGGTDSSTGGRETASGGTEGGAPAATGGAGGAQNGGADAAGADAGGATSGGVQAGGAEPGGADVGGAEPGGSEPGGTSGTEGGAAPGGTDSGGTNAGGVGNAAGSGTGGGSTATGSDSCDAAEATPNDDRESATLYTLGTDYEACLQDEDDTDYYEFTAPADSPGGYITVAVTDVGPDADIDLAIWSAADNGEFERTYTSTNGKSVYVFFNAKPGATFRAEVTNWGGVSAPNPYLFNATYHEVPDPNEPNDLRTEATPIEVGADVEGYMFAGWEYSTEIPPEEWNDWYVVDLEAGTTSILLSILASDASGDIRLYDSLGTQIDREYSSTNGSSVLLERDLATAGTYYVMVRPWNTGATRGESADVPHYLTVPYTLTITQ